MLCKSILGQNVSASHPLESQREKKGGGKKKKACLFEPVQVVCLESGEAHVVAAGAAVAGRAGRAGNAYFVGGLSDPVAPAEEKPGSSVTILLQNLPDQLLELAKRRALDVSIRSTFRMFRLVMCSDSTPLCEHTCPPTDEGIAGCAWNLRCDFIQFLSAICKFWDVGYAVTVALCKDY